MTTDPKPTHQALYSDLPERVIFEGSEEECLEAAAMQNKDDAEFCEVHGIENPDNIRVIVRPVPEVL